MMTAQPGVMVLGTRGHVVMIEVATGAEIWRTKLPYTGMAMGGSLVTILWQKGLLFAASAGHLFRLDPASGNVLWRNELRGLGFDHIHLALEGANTMDALNAQSAQLYEQQQQGGCS